MRRLRVLFLIAAIAGIAAASESLTPQTDQSMSPFQVVERQVTETGITATFVVEEPTWVPVEGIDGSQLELAVFPLSGALTEIGMPSVPVAATLFRLPPRSGATVDVLEAEYVTYSDVEYASLFSNELNEGANDIEYGHADRELDSWYPGILAEVGEPAILHDFRVTNLMTYPVQVNPARNEVRVYTTLRVQVRYEGIDERNALDDWPTRLSRSMIPKYEAFLDWELDELNDYEFYDGNVIVVMRDDDALWTAMEEWFEWKRQKGWKLDFIHESDVLSWSASQIRGEIIERYQNARDKFDNVVIIGDDAGSFDVPAGSGGSGSGHGDHPYCCIVGNDNLGDVGIGRISIQTVTQAIAYKNKVLAYERDVDFNNTDWYLRAMLNRANTGNGISKIIMHRYYKYLLLQQLGFTQVDTINWGGQDPYAMQKIDEGVSFYSERGYLNQGLSIGEVNALNNDFMTPVVIDVTCGTGNWSGNTGINEAFMLAGTVNVPRGGVVAMSMATSGTHPNFNNVLSGASGWSMLQVQWPTPGDMMLAAKINGWVNYEGRSAELDNFLQWYNLMGDPLIYMWTDMPHVFDVDAPATMTLGQREYVVTVEEEGMPVKDAWVTFYMDSGINDIQISKYTDENGVVTFYPDIRLSGEAVLTVTKLNFAPTQIAVDVNAVGASVGYQSVDIIDNGMGGTFGDGDGIPEAGERVGLQLMLKNFGGSAENDVSITADIDDPYIEDVYGSVSIDQLTPSQSALGAGMILVEIAPYAQDRWVVPITFEIETESGSTTDGLELSIAAPNYVVTSVATNGNLNPGTIREVTLTLGNAGGSDAAAGNAMLISMDPWLRFVEYAGTIPAAEVNETVTSSVFRAEALIGSFPGYNAKAMLLVTTETGQVDTSYTSIVFGTRSASDPIGPDRYGYMGFDNIDTDWNYAPTYNWIEINPEVNGHDFEGTEIDIHDLAENDDEGDTLNLAVHGFPITYYGETFDYISITTNGFLAMGLQPSICSNRNWSIPTPAGPSYMIAPYWDELQTNGDCAILYYHDEENGRLIFEFYKMRHHDTSYESTFEVIFYDTEMYPTATGDNEFVFQYGECDHSSGGMSYDVPYWTTGIENGDQSDGLLVAYWSEYSPGAAAIEQGRAIKFTTNIDVPVGRIHGTIVCEETRNPIANASVVTSDGVFQAITDAEGEYVIDSVFIGNYDLIVVADCFNDGLIEGVSVADGSDITANEELLHPEFELSTLDLETELPPDSEATVQFEIINNGNGPLYYETDLSFANEAMLSDGNRSRSRGPVHNGNELDEAWDQVFQFDLDPMEQRYRGIVYDGQYFWVTGSNSYDVSGPNKLYQYDEDGVYIATFDQPVPAENRTSQGFYGMAWDGEYLYAADNGIMYQMEFEGDEWTAVDSWDIPANPARYIVLDPENYIFYVGDFGTEIRAVHPDSQNVIYEFGQDFFPRGGGWYPEDEDGYYVYFIAQENGSPTVSFIKMDPVTGDIRPVYYTDIADGYLATGGDVTYLWDPSIWQFVSVLESSDIDRVNLWEIDTYSNWVEVVNPTGMIEAGASGVIEVSLHSYGLPPDTFNVAVDLYHNACTESQEWVDVVLIVTDPKAIDDPDAANLPTEFTFEGTYPNPFNPTTSVHFGLPETALVKANVFNLLGQKVATLANQPMQAGYHQLSFDGSNLASGMYFLNFQAGPIHKTTKLILMK